MMKSIIVALIVAVFTLIVAPNIGGEPLAKHPRVAELEEKMAKDASNYLNGRFPSSPFLVQVSIDPLRRYPTANNGYGKQSEQLPYYELEEEELLDEWDDKRVSLHELMLRITKVKVTLSLPAKISQAEADEIRTSLTSLLHLVPARDEVEILRKDWGMSIYNQWTYAAAGAAALFLLGLIIGLYLITKSSTNKIATALAEQKSGTNAPPPAQARQLSGDAAKEKDGKLQSADLKFSDPVKIREIVGRTVMTLSDDENFPHLDEMIALDEYCRQDPSSFGALLKEFPLVIQGKLFSYSFSDKWLDALIDPGDYNSNTLSFLLRMEQNRIERDADWEDLLLHVWRLDDKRIQFMHEIKQDEALAILAELPNSIALPVARAAFPGNWGALLDPSFVPKKLETERIQALIGLTMVSKRPRDLRFLKKYKKEYELIKFLKTVSVQEEREIYKATPKDSLIHTLRPPFFRLLEQPKEILEGIVNSYSVDDWAMLLFDVPKQERRPLEKLFGEKQRFLYTEKLKLFDKRQPDREAVGSIREVLGRQIADILDLMEQEKAKPVSEQQQQQDEDNDEVTEDLAA